MRLQFTEFAQLVGRKPGGRVIGDRPETHGPEAGKLNQVGPISDRLWFNEMKVPGKGDTGNPQSRHEDQDGDENLGPRRPFQMSSGTDFSHPGQVATAIDDDLGET